MVTAMRNGSSVWIPLYSFKSWRDPSTKTSSQDVRGTPQEAQLEEMQAIWRQDRESGLTESCNDNGLKDGSHFFVLMGRVRKFRELFSDGAVWHFGHARGRRGQVPSPGRPLHVRTQSHATRVVARPEGRVKLPLVFSVSFSCRIQLSQPSTMSVVVGTSSDNASFRDFFLA